MAVDVEAELVQFIAGLDGVAHAGVDVPARVEQRLPFVAVRLLPGSEWSPTWQGPAGHLLQSVDIDLFTRGVEGVGLARSLRSHLSTMNVRGLVPHACPPLSRRPDHNEHVRVLGAVFDFIVRT